MKRKPLVAVVGASSASDSDLKNALAAGEQIAKEGWILINGGLEGVMQASAEGAAKEKGIIVGILPGPLADVANPHITIPIATNLGNARNAIIAQSADFLIAIGKGLGTLSEIALALQNKKKVYALQSWEVEAVFSVQSISEAIGKIKKEVESSQLEPSAANLSKVFQGSRLV